MKEYGLYFATDSFTLIPNWKELVINKANVCKYIRIDCFDKDINAMSMLRELGGAESKELEHMTSFRFESNECNINELIVNRIADNRLCWFSVFLENEDHVLFSFEHHASEFSLRGLTEVELNDLVAIMPKDANCISYEIEE